MENRKIAVSAARIRTRVRHMARIISGDYEGCKLHVIVVLRGGFVFAADLVRHLRSPLRETVPVDFVWAESYGTARHSSGKLRIRGSTLADPTALVNRDVLLLDDVYDTGNTVRGLTKSFLQAGASTVRAAVLVWKTDKVRDEWGLRPVRYFAFALPSDGFLSGYGMDRDGHGGRAAASVWREPDPED